MTVREARDAKKLTQAELARITGLSQSEIARIERGVRVPRVKIALRVSRSLGVTVEELWGHLVEQGWTNYNGRSPKWHYTDNAVGVARSLCGEWTNEDPTRSLNLETERKTASGNCAKCRKLLDPA